MARIIIIDGPKKILLSYLESYSLEKESFFAEYIGFILYPRNPVVCSSRGIV